MAHGHKQEFPPLLPAGLHPKTMDELRQLCVNAFPTSVRRPKIFEGLEQIIWELSDLGIVTDVWVDGSFLTQKIEPDDSDILVCVKREFQANSTPEQRRYLSDLQIRKSGFKQKFSCDVYVYVDQGHSTSRWLHGYWVKQFGLSRNNEEKGIAVVSTPTNTP